MSHPFIIYKPGDKWTCECGTRYTLDHEDYQQYWKEGVLHICNCGREHWIQEGIITLRRDADSRLGATEKC